MLATKTTRKVQKVVGRIDPGAMYTTEGCMRFGGIGRDSLIDARATGIVHPIPVGKRVYYRGDELIEWIKSHKGL